MGYINISNNAKMRILLIIFIFFYTSFAKENNEIDILVANFCKTTDKYDTLGSYHCSAPLLVNVKLGEYFCYLVEC